MKDFNRINNLYSAVKTNAIRILLVFIFLVTLYSCKQPKKHDDSALSFSNLHLPVYSQKQLETDFNLLVNSLKEAHTGLYWYSTEQQFDSIVGAQRALIKDSLNGLAFYNIVAPIAAFTKEDHCDISVSDEIEQALTNDGLFLPLLFIHLYGRAFILNNPLAGHDIKGFELLAVNDVPVAEIRKRLFATFASDGYILSSKFRYLDFRGFSREYAKVIRQQKENSIEVLNPKTFRKERYTLNAVSLEKLRTIQKDVFHENNIRNEKKKPAHLELSGNNTAVLTFSTFSNKKFKASQMNFKSFVDSCFNVIFSNNIKNLIIDIRDNGGGSEGNEDFLFSYLTDKPYNKYKYVELSRINFSFLEYTNYSKKEDRAELEQELKAENQQSANGKYYRKPGIYNPEPVKNRTYKNKLFILISGWTYSGGAEFASLIREHTDAVFIGEETGGGFFGNTSGTLLELTLPNTRLVIDIPVLRFVLDVKKGKTGRGVIPDSDIQPTFDEFVNGYDTELEFAKKVVDGR